MILQTLRAVVGPLPPAKPGPAFWQSRLHERCPGARPRFRRVISSVVERFVHIEDVGSSNLSSPTSFPQGPCALRSPNALQASDRVKLHARHLPVSPVLRRPGFRPIGGSGETACRNRLGWLKGGADGRLAQLVERFVYTEDVGSSSLSSPTRPPTRPESRRAASCDASPSDPGQGRPDLRIRQDRGASCNVRPGWSQSSLTGHAILLDGPQRLH